MRCLLHPALLLLSIAVIASWHWITSLSVSNDIPIHSKSHDSHRNKSLAENTVHYQFPIIDLDPINRALFNKSMGANAEGKTLMFCHIPKTGGTTMGVAARNHGIYWIWKLDKKLRHSVKDFQGISLCKQSIATKDYAFDDGWCGSSMWHIPLRWWTEYFMENAPKQTTNTLQWYFDSSNVDWFCIVRNPFSRMVSEYKHRSSEGHVRKQLNYWTAPCSAEAMNIWLTRNLDKEWGTKHWDNHLTPQYEYVFDSNGKQIIKHVLRFENVQNEVMALFSAYNLDDVYRDYFNMHLIPGIKNGKGECTHLTVSMISETNKQIIRERYKADFETFGYSLTLL